MKCKVCKKSCKFLFWVLVIALIGMQFIPVDRTNPPVTGTISNAPADVIAVMRRSCFDCHSNETVWPWYSYVAPMSWLVADDVHKAREHMNFSTWSDYSTKKQNHSRKGCGKEVEVGEMPLWYYLPLHPEAKLSQEDVDLLVAWSREGQSNELIDDDDDDDSDFDDHDHDHDD